MSFLIVVGICVLLIFYLISIYNKLVTLKNRFNNAFSQIDVQLKRRYELIPNLVETAKAFMKHEKETLESVIKARNLAVTANQNVSRQPNDPHAMQQLLGAEGGLSEALSRLMMVSEAYPELKSDTNMRQLSEELTSTENKIAFSRQAYNDGVTLYNIACETFPNSLIAGVFRFAPAALFEITRAEERDAVKVKFG